MLWKAIGVFFLILIGGVGYLIFNYQVVRRYDENGNVVKIEIVPRGSAMTADPSLPETPVAPPATPTGTAPAKGTIRIASYNLGGLDEAKWNVLRINDILVRLATRFDILAVQGIRGKNQGVLVRWVEQIKAQTGRVYDFAASPVLQQDGIEHYSAFLFDKSTVVVDRTTVRFVDDAMGRFRHNPLTASFLARGLYTNESFTFTLINVETDPQKTSLELDLLADVFKRIREEPRNEDDIIMLGDFQADENHLGRLGSMMSMSAAIVDTPTTVQGTRLVDNIVFNRLATNEYTGRAEVFDMMREFDMTAQGAAEISEHLPVWAEFSIYEGGQRGFVPK